MKYVLTLIIYGGLLLTPHCHAAFLSFSIANIREKIPLAPTRKQCLGKASHSLVCWCLLSTGVLEIVRYFKVLTRLTMNNKICMKS